MKTANNVSSYFYSDFKISRRIKFIINQNKLNCNTT